MEIIRFDRKDLRKLKTYEIHSDIYNTESYLYIYKNMLLKLFASKDEDVLNNKLFVLNKLFYLKEYINIKEFVQPESLVKIGSINKGYTMEFIKNNTNLSLIFKSEKVSIEDKVFFLHTILRIIERIEKEEVLNSVGFNRELLDTIFNIYKKSDNYFDYNLVDTITPKLVLKYKEKYVKK